MFVSEGPRLVAAAPSVGMTTMLQQTTVFQPSPMTAGTPIILAPRIQTPQLPVANVTSLANPAVLAAAAVGGSHTPSIVTPANAATVPTSGLVYSYDTAYLPRMLEYSTGVEPSTVGKCLCFLLVH